MPYPLPLLIASLEAHANPADAAAMTGYMRDLFPFYGVKKPIRASLQAEFFRIHGLPSRGELAPVVRELWAMPPRECQYAALDLLEKTRRLWNPADISLFEELVVTKSWWDTVDLLATHMIGELCRKFPSVQGERLPAWRTSENLWLRRVALLFQLHYKQNTDFPLLQAIIRENLGSTEFFINKAIGWALREYSKVDEQAVRQFVAKTPLSPLSAREALKWLERRAVPETDGDENGI